MVSIKILDPDHTISLTNIAMMIILGKIAAAPTIDWQVIAGLLLALVSYGHKRQLNAKRAVQSLASDDRVKDLEGKVLELMAAYNIRKLK